MPLGFIRQENVQDRKGVRCFKEEMQSAFEAHVKGRAIVSISVEGTVEVPASCVLDTGVVEFLSHDGWGSADQS